MKNNIQNLIKNVILQKSTPTIWWFYENSKKTHSFKHLPLKIVISQNVKPNNNLHFQNYYCISNKLQKKEMSFKQKENLKLQ